MNDVSLETHNEVAHAQYALQTGPARSDVLLNNVQTHLALLVSDVLLTTESVIGLFLAVWARLQCDCTEMLYWLKGTGENVCFRLTVLFIYPGLWMIQGAIPPCITVYAEQGKNLYAGIASGLDVFVSGLDPSWFTQLSQK